jgi:hypothetical protein
MLPEENKTLVRRFIEEGFNKRNISVTDEYFAEDFIHHGESFLCG